MAPEIVPIEILFNKTGDITIDIDAKGRKVLLRGQLQVLTVFNAAGTDLISAGTNGTNLLNAQTVAATGVFATSYVLLENERATVTVGYDYTSTAPTTGRAILWLEVIPVPSFYSQNS